MSDNALDLSVIIVTYNSLPAIVGCLDSLARSDRSIGFETIIVDNQSTDSTVKSISGHVIKPKVTVWPTNLGFAEGCNLGAKSAAGEFLLFLNPDVEIESNTLSVLVSFCRARPNAGLVTGRLRHPDGSFQPNCRRFPSVRNLMFSRGSWLSRFAGDSGTYTMSDASEPMVVEAVAGTMLAVSRKQFSALGGFDGRFFMYMEDTDLSIRAHKAGRENYFLPQAGAMHLWAKGSSAGRIRRLYLHHRSVWKYFVKHFPGLFPMIMLIPMLVMNFALAALLGTRQSGKS